MMKWKLDVDLTDVDVATIITKEDKIKINWNVTEKIAAKAHDEFNIEVFVAKLMIAIRDKTYEDVTPLKGDYLPLDSGRRRFYRWLRQGSARLVGVVSVLMVTHALGGERQATFVKSQRASTYTTTIIAVAKPRESTHTETIQIANLTPHIKVERPSQKILDLLVDKGAILRTLHIGSGWNDVAPIESLFINRETAATPVRTQFIVNKPGYIYSWQMAHVANANVSDAMVHGFAAEGVNPMRRDRQISALKDTRIIELPISKNNQTASNNDQQDRSESQHLRESRELPRVFGKQAFIMVFGTIGFGLVFVGWNEVASRRCFAGACILLLSYGLMLSAVIAAFS